MAMSQCDIIDFSALERELQVAVESERRHQRENDAKLRAVCQRASYDQFRDLVLACHMKPLEKKDKDGALRKQPWNPVAPSNK
ncbi:dynein axonemal assembly factor 19 [Maylandia zebra]|uniref:dynein axonemal assembly factor 19 n=1 Tax=Maylandia zebra TaxID=106582 RepID=UPI000329AC35